MKLSNKENKKAQYYSSLFLLNALFE